MAVSNDVKKIYKEVVNDVCNAVREALSEEGFDDHTLQELKSMWMSRLESSKALEPLANSAVDESTTRNHQRNRDMNQQPSIANKQINPQRGPVSQTNTINTFQQQPIGFTASSGQSQSSSGNIVTQPINQFQRTGPQIRPHFNPSLMGNNPMKSTNQLDGSNDEYTNPENTSRRSKKKKRNIQISFQLDGTGPTASDEEDEEDDNDVDGNDDVDDLNEDDDEDGNDESKEDPNPLCSDDDVSDEEPAELFETDNVIVCQYEKISRTKNKWRFTLKSGVMSINGRDQVFSKALGEADW